MNAAAAVAGDASCRFFFSLLAATVANWKLLRIKLESQRQQQQQRGNSSNAATLLQRAFAFNNYQSR